MKLSTAFAFAGLVAFSGVALAASPAPAPAPAAAKPAATAPAAPAAATPAADAGKDAINKQCIADADAKGLHGKERKKFKYECKKAAKKN